MYSTVTSNLSDRGSSLPERRNLASVNSPSPRVSLPGGPSLESPRKRILILIKGLGLGGAERLLVNALPYLSRDEFDYRVAYFLPWKDALVPDFESCGIPVTCFDCRTPYSPIAIHKIGRYLRRHDIALLHSHLPSASIAGRVASRLNPSPATVYTEHGCWNRFASCHSRHQPQDAPMERFDDRRLKRGA